MKIVVAGGTGFLGRHISRALLEADHQVTVLGRNPDKVGRIPLLAGANATLGDVTDPAKLRGRLDGADAVVGAVQFPNYPIEQPRKGLTFDRYDRQGTEHLIAEAQRAGVQRYLYISGANASPTSDKSWYRAKGRAEESIRSSGLRYAILRPSWAYGPEDKALNKFRAIARFSPIVPKPGTRDQRIQPVFVGDIAVAVARIFERDEAWDKTFEIGGPEIMSMDEVIQTLLEVIGRRKPIVAIPAVLAKLGTAPLTLLPTPPMSPGGIDFAVQSGVVDSAELEEILDVHPVGLREGLASYMGADR